MPGLLTRYVAVELCKTMFLTTTILVTVIAFGAAIKPLAQNLISGGDIIKYVMVASVPMLQYALPFAAGFAATLVMHRFSVDNELLAMSVSGLSHGRIFRPLLLIGLGLFLFMVVLVNWGVPYFWARMEAMLARDVTRLLASSVRRGEAFSLGNTQIFADDVMIIDDPDDTNAESRLVLVGVAALETDNQKKPKTEFTADYATLDVYRIDGRAILKLALGESTIYREGDQALVRVPTAEPNALDLGQGFAEEPKSLTLGKMFHYRTNSENFPSVSKIRNRAFEQLVAANAWSCVTDEIDDGRSLVLRDNRRDEAYSIQAGSIKGAGLGGGVTVTELQGGLARRRAEASTARLELVESMPGQTPRFDLFFEPEAITDLEEPDTPRTRWQARVPRLELVACIDDVDVNASNAQLLESIKAMDSREGSRAAAIKADLVKTGTDLEKAHRDLRWDIDARMQQRFAQSALAPLLLLLGGVLAVSMKRSVPLLVYLVAFLPSIADILLISAGEQTLRAGPSAYGHILLWSGNAVVAVVMAAAWMRLRRN